MSSPERRNTPTPVSRRSATGRRTIGGYAAKFSPATSAPIPGGFRERIAPGFFDRAAATGWAGVIAKYNHDENMVLGTANAGTLRLKTDRVGLIYEVDLPAARADVYELVERGDVSTSSFQFVADEDEWSSLDGYPLRTLISGRLFDVAPVNTPAYPDTSVALRSLAKAFHAPLEDVQAMARAGQLARLTGTRSRSAHIALARAMKLR